jgi:hypothetical protein
MKKKTRGGVWGWAQALGLVLVPLSFTTENFKMNLKHFMVVNK